MLPQLLAMLENNTTPEPWLLLIHPVGVGLSSQFWNRLIRDWHSTKTSPSLLAPDLLGCGAAPCQAQPLTPEDWADQLITLMREQDNGPAVLVTQGASLPIALAIVARAPELVRALVAISPPGWLVLKQAFPQARAHLLWRIVFQGLIGNLFYRYARRRSFLNAFSKNNLFARTDSVDEEWLEMLQQGSRSMETRWAVYSFLAGFWRRDWEPQLTELKIPMQILFGANATGIGSSKNWDDLDQRLKTYADKLPNASISTIPGRNVLPYESTEDCVTCIREWLTSLPA